VASSLKIVLEKVFKLIGVHSNCGKTFTNAFSKDNRKKNFLTGKIFFVGGGEGILGQRREGMWFSN
jgi:hypothetical protein